VELVGRGIVHSGVIAPFTVEETVIVPVGVPANCGAAVEVKTRLDSLPTATVDDETLRTVVVGSWSTDKGLEDEVEAVKLVSPWYLAVMS
jgi:hypothetical protein